MCTGITYSNLVNEHFLARTMDFSFELQGGPMFCPRNYEWASDAGQEKHRSTYGLIGAGREFDKLLFADGVNEKGLAMAALYLPDEVTYYDECVPGQVNLGPHEFLLWVLTNCQSIAELESQLSKINLVDVPTRFLEATTPLHWLLADESGRTAVIEPVMKELKLIDNPVGVLTNSPTLDWHLSNLRNYIGISPNQFESHLFGQYEASPFSQGSGTFGLPGGYTPPERFVRATLIKEAIQPVYTLEGSLTNIWYVLQSVFIPRGIVKKSDGAVDYTQYVSAMSATTKTYFFSKYGNSQINQVSLTEDLMNTQLVPLAFEVSSKQSLNILK